jgi:hypothetical protein
MDNAVIRTWKTDCGEEFSMWSLAFFPRYTEWISFSITRCLEDSGGALKGQTDLSGRIGRLYFQWDGIGAFDMELEEGETFPWNL